MSKYSQLNSPIAVTTPLGPDVLLLEKLTGTEGISELFRFQLDLLAEKPIPFDGLLGQKVTVTLTVPGSSTRYFNGIVSRLIQDGRVQAADDKSTLLRYQAELVPQLWLLTKNVQSRIFQHLSIPDILKQVLKNLDVSYDIHGDFAPRDFCVQYRESDCAFASRLMEEEGIFYYFQHTADGHRLHVTNYAMKHQELQEPSTINYDDIAGGKRDAARVAAWRKMQEVCVGRYSLWDHSFELPGKNLQAEQGIPDTVTVGQVNHKLHLDSNSALEHYDYPGRYAQRFAGINKDGGEQASHLQKIFDDNQRTVKIRMEQEAAQSLAIEGESNAAHFTPGYQFTLGQHFYGDGDYLLTRVTHSADLRGTYVTGTVDPGMVYQNRFECFPATPPYRPALNTKRPTVDGTQTALVVGPPGEEIFCDKYGRVKVQFNWDRQGKKNADSSCWLRVAQAWAGKGFGALQIPRIGQEVIIDFLEGDPDRPIVVGNVYNAEQMPPYQLPDNKTYSGFKTRSQGGSASNANELRFQDVLGSELLHLQAEKNMTHHVENSYYLKVGGTSGSGSGGGSEDPAPDLVEKVHHSTDIGSGSSLADKVFHVEAPQKIEIIEGLSTELVAGLNTEIIVGGNVEVVLGAGNVEVIAGLGNFETIVGMNKEILIGPQLETIVGDVTSLTTGAVLEGITGNVTSFTVGTVWEVITGNVTEITTGAVTETITGDVTSTTTGNKIETLIGDYTEDISGTQTHLKSGVHVHSSTGTFTIDHVGSYTLVVSAPLTMTAPVIALTATTSITLTVGSTIIELTQTGLSINCANFTLTSQTGVIIGGSDIMILADASMSLESGTPLQIL